MTRTRRGALKLCSRTKFQSSVTDRFHESVLSSRTLEPKISQTARSKNGAPRAPRLFFHRIVCHALVPNPTRLVPNPTRRIEAHRLVAMPASEAVAPAMHVRFMPLVAPVVRRRAVVAVAHDRFVHAVVVVAHDRSRIYIYWRSLRARRSTEKQKTAERRHGQRRLTKNRLQDRLVPLHDILLEPLPRHSQGFFAGGCKTLCG